MKFAVVPCYRITTPVTLGTMDSSLKKPTQMKPKINDYSGTKIMNLTNPNRPVNELMSIDQGNN